MPEYEYSSGGVFYSFFLAPKKYWSNFERNGIIEEQKTFTGLNDSKWILHRPNIFRWYKVTKFAVTYQRVGKNPFRAQL